MVTISLQKDSINIKRGNNRLDSMYPYNSLHVEAKDASLLILSGEHVILNEYWENIEVDGTTLNVSNFTSVLSGLFKSACSCIISTTIDYADKHIVWVDPSFKLDSDGTIAKPFKNVQDAVNSYTGSDTVLINLAPYDYSSLTPSLTIDKNAIIKGSGYTILGDININSTDVFSLEGVSFNQIVANTVGNVSVSNSSAGSVNVKGSEVVRLYNLKSISPASYLNISNCTGDAIVRSCDVFTISLDAIGGISYIESSKLSTDDNGNSLTTTDTVKEVHLDSSDLASIDATTNNVSFGKIVKSDDCIIQAFNSELGEYNLALKNVYSRPNLSNGGTDGFLPYRTLWVDRSFSGESNGTIAAPFTKIQDAIDSIVGKSVYKIKVAPNSFKTSEPTITINKNIILEGNSGYVAAGSTYVLNNIVIDSASTYFNINGFIINDISGSSANSFLDIKNSFIQTINIDTIGAFNMDAVRFGSSQININEITYDASIYNCVGTSLNVTTARSISCVNTTFKNHYGLSDDVSIQLGTGVKYLVLQNCSLTWFNTDLNSYVYRKIINNNVPVYAFSSDIGEASKSLSNLYYIEIEDTDIISKRIPVNYSTKDSKLSSHLDGIDEALSSNILYIKSGQGLPVTGKLGDKAVITDDGTSNGTVSKVYQWDGFRWIIFSYSTNVSFVKKAEESPSITINGEGIDFDSIEKVVSANYIYLEVDKKVDGTPSTLAIQNIMNFIDLKDNPNYIVTQLSVSPDSDCIIDGLFTNYEDGIDIQFLAVDTIEQTKDNTIEISIKNCKTQSIDVTSNAKSITIENCYAKDTFIIYIDENPFISSITATSLSGVQEMTFNIRTSEDSTLDINDVTFKDGDSSFLNIDGSSNYSNSIKVNANVSSVENFSLKEGLYDIESFKITSEELITVNISDTTFTDPAMLDVILKAIIAGGMSKGTVSLSNTNGTKNDETIKLFTDKGITVIQ